MKERIPDQFDVSTGNLEVLKKIPEIMNDAHWRKKLRMLVIDFIFYKNHEDDSPLRRKPRRRRIKR